MDDRTRAANGLTAGYGESVITPPLGVELCGYGYYRERRAETVLDDLKARAVCVSVGDATLVLMACDLIGFNVATSDAIRSAVADEVHVPRDHVLLACTHTHTGPASEFLRSCGEIAPDYVRRLPEAIVAAARHAARDRAPCAMRIGSEATVPIGYNRRLKSFQPMDATVAAVIFERKHGSIGLCEYACHAVTLGPGTAVSADWPGAAVKALEREGYRGICFQGFCGDIDPVCFKNKWGSGTPADLDGYGRIIAQAVLAIARRGQPSTGTPLSAVEKRISLPLSVPPDKAAIDREYEALLSGKGREGLKKFADAWRQAALEQFDALRRYPYWNNIPIQAMRLDGMNLIALPAEVFCEYGLALRAPGVPLLTVGYANGNCGYWPMAEAYEHPADYAAYHAPKVYHVFPFASSVQDIVLQSCRTLIS